MEGVDEVAFSFGLVKFGIGWVGVLDFKQEVRHGDRRVRRGVTNSKREGQGVSSRDESMVGKLEPQSPGQHSGFLNSQPCTDTY